MNIMRARTIKDRFTLHISVAQLYTRGAVLTGNENRLTLLYRYAQAPAENQGF